MGIKKLLASLIKLATGRREEPVPAQPQMDRDTPFEVLLAQANDFDLIEATYSKIQRRIRNGTPMSLPEERVITMVWFSAGIIDNGGFEYLFSGTAAFDPEFRRTAQAHLTVGLERSYEAFQRALALFPGGIIPHQGDERVRIYKQADESVRDEISTLYFRDGWDNVREQKLAQYIRDNALRLGDLDGNEATK